MANYVIQEMPEQLTGDKRTVYPRMLTYTMFDYEKVLDQMQTYLPSFGKGAMRAVIDALSQTLQTWLPEGHTMKVDGLGVFSLSLGFAGDQAEEPADAAEAKGEPKTKYRHVCVKDVNFRVDQELVEKMNHLANFVREEQGVSQSSALKYTLEERRERALAKIDEAGYLTLSDYVCLNDVTRTRASRDLKQFVAQPDSLIAERGSGSHKVWVKRRQAEE